MAFFVPILAAVGGGSALAGGLAVASAAVGVMGAVQQQQAGKIERAEYNLQAKQVGDAARAREIERKRDLLTALATQAATAGAQGVAMQGSNVGIAKADIARARNDLLVDTANTRTQQRVLRTRGINAQRAGTARAVTSLVKTASDLYAAAG
jgi:hypothetical protein